MADRVAVIDGGGSKTRGASLDRSGAVTLTSVFGGMNPQDNPAWRDTLAAVLGALGPADALTLGMAGYGEIPSVNAVIEAEVARHRPGAVVVNDTELTLRAAYPDGGGVLLLAGTGSMAMTEGPSGVIRVGGWGEAFGDEGSGHWIGRRAFGIASQELDGRLPDSGFGTGLCAALGVDPAEPYGPLIWVQRNAHHRSAMAGLSRWVDDRADGGDPVAKGLLEEAADHLARHVEALRDRAQLPADAPWTPAGSVMQSRTVMQTLARRLGPPQGAVLVPLAGGLLHAARQAGWRVTADWAVRVTRQIDPVPAETAP